MVVAPNAALTLVAGGGAAADNDRPAGVDTTRWTGRVDARVHERTVEAITGQRVDVATITTLVVPRPVGRLILIGDTITYEHRGVTVARPVRDVRGNDITDTTRVWLQDQ